MDDVNQQVLEEFYNIISSNKIELFENNANLRTSYLTVVLENIYQEHNASAVMRSCDAFGIRDLHVIEKNNPYVLQRDIARGAGRWVNLVNYSQKSSPTTICLNSLKSKGYKIIATSPNSDLMSINDLPLSNPLALVFGTEKEGISHEASIQADYTVHIPMYGFSESFNVSVSVALALQKLRDRLHEEKTNFLLSEKEKVELKIGWCANIIREGRKLEEEIRKRILDKRK